MNFKELADHFLNTRGPGVAIGSLLRHASHLNGLEAHFGPDSDPARITNEAIRAYAAKQLAKGLTPENINLSLRTLDRCLEAALERGILAARPHVDMLPRLSGVAKPFSVEDLSKLVTAETFARRADFWLFIAWTGLSAKEAVSLKWEDFREGERPYADIGTQTKIRRVFLIPQALACLGGRRERGPVFPFENVSQVARCFRNNLKKGRAEKHTLRELGVSFHFWAKLLGMPLREYFDSLERRTLIATFVCHELFKLSRGRNRR
ncbi:MAG: hypothetical protein LBF41_08835 [Deltaproteobacteria bacterium]|jgi:integrase|nr:hypothetical protein [Deltaproteobacteria bacterium]